MIFPTVHFKQLMTRDAPTGTLGLATWSGWMTSELFIQVMKHFIHHTNSKKERNVQVCYFWQPWQSPVNWSNWYGKGEWSYDSW
jgi:hypothetical protein